MLARLLHAIREGDRAAFDLALDPERVWLLDRAHRVVNGTLRRFIDPDDLVQDVLLIAYRKLSGTRLQQQSSLRNWLDQVLTRRVADERRRHLRLCRRDLHTQSLDDAQGRTSTGTTLNLGAVLSGSGCSPSMEAAAGEGLARLRAILAQLPDDHRQVIELLRLEGLPAEEVATRMQRTPAAVYKLFARALESARGLLLQPQHVPTPGDLAR